ncbi:DUF192 domain-containing protein [Roseovarius spongiae]|uniref:DUF192 domain-containing protein n=1 Tax=Roseovarius spongiae TaxID=2320272 RepID=A0A3A8B5N2_9RHOB|nr:DUF192 domain-containing protein [Roseovarius spongiae]RKF15106.1 DUF192 domain-containing protein [Roseovarius spongiae]
MGKRGEIRKAIAASLLALTIATPAAADVCREDRVDLRGDWGQANFTVELADDDAERAQGLMHRESLARSAGMLFVYPHEKRVAFWMKNTLIPLDMIFLDATGTVRKVHSNATPGDLSPIFGPHDTRAVLEINGGLARRLGITRGSVLRHPAFASDRAAWPC